MIYVTQMSFMTTALRHGRSKMRYTLKRRTPWHFTSYYGLHTTIGDIQGTTGEGSSERIYKPGCLQRPKQKDYLKAKFRQHVNPLSDAYQTPINLAPQWMEEVFEMPSQKIVVDVGCAKGTWILQNAEQNLDTNYLGLEIRRPVVEYCIERAKRRKLSNVHFLATNANIDLPIVMSDLLKRKVCIDMVTIHHPDPHFKKKHKKRRVVTDELVETLANILPSGCRIFLQSDIRDVCEDMADSFLGNAKYSPALGYHASRLEDNASPHSVMTEREVATLNKGLPVFRMMVERA